jgi:hypothetical protein
MTRADATRELMKVQEMLSVATQIQTYPEEKVVCLELITSVCLPFPVLLSRDYEEEEPWPEEGTLCFVWDGKTRPDKPSACYTTSTRGYFKRNSNRGCLCMPWVHWEPICTGGCHE